MFVGLRQWLMSLNYWVTSTTQRRSGGSLLLGFRTGLHPTKMSDLKSLKIQHGHFWGFRVTLQIWRKEDNRQCKRVEIIITLYWLRFVRKKMLIRSPWTWIRNRCLHQSDIILSVLHNIIHKQMQNCKVWVVYVLILVSLFKGWNGFTACSCFPLF